MPYGWPSTRIEWMTLTPVQGQIDPMPGPPFPLTDYYDSATGGSVVVLPGIQGFDAPPVEVFYDELPGLDGAYLRHQRTASREVFIPIELEAPDRGALLALKRGLLGRLVAGMGRLRVTEGDNTSRFLDCLYTGGAEGDYSIETSGFLRQRYGLIFRAFDPYWYSGETVDRVFASIGETPVPFFSSPFFGLHINRAHSINQETTLTASGDVPTWPVWRIAGPMDGVTFTRTDTDGTQATFSLDVTLSTGETVLIDTRPGRKQVTLIETGVNLWDRLGPNPNLWAIKPGSNTVLVNVTGTGTDTAVNLSYRPRFISA